MSRAGLRQSMCRMADQGHQAEAWIELHRGWGSSCGMIGQCQAQLEVRGVGHGVRTHRGALKVVPPRSRRALLPLLYNISLASLLACIERDREFKAMYIPDRVQRWTSLVSLATTRDCGVIHTGPGDHVTGVNARSICGVGRGLCGIRQCICMLHASPASSGHLVKMHGQVDRYEPPHW